MRNKLLLQLLFLALLTGLVFTSCSKDDDDVKPKEEKKEKPDKKAEENPDKGMIRLYKVSGEDISKTKDYKVSGKNKTYQTDKAKHKQMWKLTKNVIPRKPRKMLVEFLIFNGEDQDGTAGWVTQTKDDLTEWQMGLAIDYAYNENNEFNADGEFAYTVIHEFGHILTLNNTQIDASITDAASSKTYFTQEGSARASSYLYKHYKKFWADIHEEYKKIGDDEDVHQAFYEKYKDRFVTQYASTNPEEDIAETFSFFVTKKDKPTGNSIADQKVRSMYDYDELIEIREYIRRKNKLKSTSVGITLPEPGGWKKANTIGKPNEKR
jgi:hypothetical protein